MVPKIADVQLILSARSGVGLNNDLMQALRNGSLNLAQLCRYMNAFKQNKEIMNMLGVINWWNSRFEQNVMWRMGDVMCIINFRKVVITLFPKEVECISYRTYMCFRITGSCDHTIPCEKRWYLKVLRIFTLPYRGYVEQKAVHLLDGWNLSI